MCLWPDACLVQERHHYDADSDSSHESSHSSHSHSHSLTSTQVSQSLTSTARRSSQDDDRGTHEQGTAQPHTTAAQGANGEAAAAAGFAVAGGVGGATMPPRIKKRVSISVGDPALPQGQARGPSTGGAPTADPFASASVQQGILRSMRQRQQGDTGVAASAAQAPQPAAGAASAAAAAAVADPPPGATARRFTVVASPVQRSTERIHGYAGPKPAHPSRLGAVQVRNHLTYSHCNPAPKYRHLSCRTHGKHAASTLVYNVPEDGPPTCWED